MKPKTPQAPHLGHLCFETGVFGVMQAYTHQTFVTHRESATWCFAHWICQWHHISNPGLAADAISRTLSHWYFEFHPVPLPCITWEGRDGATRFLAWLASQEVPTPQLTLGSAQYTFQRSWSLSFLIALSWRTGIAPYWLESLVHRMNDAMGGHGGVSALKGHQREALRYLIEFLSIIEWQLETRNYGHQPFTDIPRALCRPGEVYVREAIIGWAINAQRLYTSIAGMREVLVEGIPYYPNHHRPAFAQIMEGVLRDLLFRHFHNPGERIWDIADFHQHILLSQIDRIY